MTDYTQSLGNCNSCGYFIGAASKCIRCGNINVKKTSLKFIRLGSIILSIVGILIMFLIYRNIEPQTVRIGSLSETSNNAYVTVKGRIVSAWSDKEKNNLKFVVDDGSGLISLNGFKKLDEYKKYFGRKLPSYGDIIKVTGSVMSSQRFGASMFLTIPDKIKVLKKYRIKYKKMNTLSLEDVGEVYRIRAKVSDFKANITKKGSRQYIITLKYKDVEKKIFMYDAVFEKLNRFQKKWVQQKGTLLYLIVSVGEYRGDWSLRLVNPSQFSYLKQKDVIKKIRTRKRT